VPPRSLPIEGEVILVRRAHRVSVPFRIETVTMDASLSRWGAIGQSRQWSTQKRTEHVNVHRDWLLEVSQALLTRAAPRLTSRRAMYPPGERNHIVDFLSRHRRVATSSRGGAQHLGPLRQGRSGSLCLGDVDPLSPSGSPERRRPAPWVIMTTWPSRGQEGVSTLSPDPTNTRTQCFDRATIFSGGSLLARQDLVLTAAGRPGASLVPPRQEGALD